MNKKIKIITTALLISAVIPTATVIADNENVKVAIGSLVARYMQNSSQAENISLNAEKQNLDNYTIINSIAEIEKQIENNNNSLTQLKTGYFNGTAIEYLEQLDYLRIYGCELEMKLELCKMQEKLDLLNSDYSEKITEQQNKQLKLEAYTLLWNIHSKQSEQAYLEGLTRQKEHELSVMRETLKLGYATESDVLAAEAELEQTKAQLAACENEYTVLTKKYEIGANEDLGQFSAVYAETAYSAKDVLKKFEQDSFYAEYYGKQAELYKTYAETLAKLPDKMPDPWYDHEYYTRIKEYITAEAAYYRNEAALAENSAERYSEGLELFVYETCGSVNSLSAQRKATAAALKAAEKPLEISRALLEEGRINETALMEAENSVLKLKAELAGVEAEIMCKKFAVENKIEGFGY